MEYPQLPLGCLSRPATAQDIWTIRRLVLSAFLDPTQLRWSQFWVIEHRGKVIACGQLRQFKQAQELGSIVVAPNWRGQRLGTYLTKLLIQQATQPLYLECLGSQLATFYQRFGFEPITWHQLPPSLQGKFGLSTLGKHLLRLPLFIMVYPVPSMGPDL